MPYVLNGEPLAYGQPFNIGDTQFTGAELIHWPREDLLALPGMTWVEPEPETEDWPSLARAALRQSDLVAIRALKAGIAYPEAWQAYDEALRAIVNGAPGPLPEQPEYPE